MPRTFYTERDIQALHAQGVRKLEVPEDVTLTELGYEMAKTLGVEIVQARGDLPPAAPVRPYISKDPRQPSTFKTAAATPAAPASPADDLRQRVRSAVQERLAGKIDPAMLDLILQRVLEQVKVG